MKTIQWYFALLILALMPVIVFAQEVVFEPTPIGIVTLLSPVIVWAIGYVSKLKDKIPGLYMLLVLALISTLITFVDKQLLNSELPFAIQILYGMSSVAFHQLYKQWKSGT